MSDEVPPEGWEIDDEVLKKAFSFGNFSEAMEFVNEVAELAEEADHHPDIRLFDYNNVEIALTTHDEGGLTEKDFHVAGQIESL